MTANSYQAIMAQRNAIMRRSVGIDYQKYATGVLAFDYQALMADTGYDMSRIRKVQRQTSVGDTPLVELGNLTRLTRLFANPGNG
ncbi:MAG: 2-amino-4-oxopentanoate thiolase subunit OrtB, partial [Gammaproteobacteria bacterium]